ncbi:MAG: hypothetical protein NVSMB5_13910 [Candidatus Velthaea sp.]
MAELKYGENAMGLIVAEGDHETDAEPCSSCSHPLLKHTGIPGMLVEFAMMTDCDEAGCTCKKFNHSQVLYVLKAEALMNAFA